MFKNHPIPSKDATCGILYMDLPAISGNAIIYSGIGFSFFGMLASVGTWKWKNRLMTKRQKEIFRSISILTVTIIIALVGSLMGKWLIGSLGIVIAVLLIAGSIFQSN